MKPAFLQRGLKRLSDNLSIEILSFWRCVLPEVFKCDLGSLVDMEFAGRRRQRPVAILDCVRDIPNFGNAMRKPSRLRHGCHSKEIYPIMQSCQHLPYEHVFAAVHQTVVKRVFRIYEARTDATFGSGFEFDHCGLKFRYVGGSAMLSELLTRESFKKSPNSIELLRFLVSDRTDDRPLMGIACDDAFSFELSHCLPNRGSADAQHFAKFSLYQSLAGLKSPTGYRLT